LLLGRSQPEGKVVQEIWKTENRWDRDTAIALGSESTRNKDYHYSIAPEDLLAAMRYARSQDLEVIGIYHSHPDHPAVPSECDRQLAWAHYSYLILSVQEGKARDYRSWILDEDHGFQPEPCLIEPTPFNLYRPPSF